MKESVPGGGPRIALLRPLMIRDFALLWTGLSISLLGDGIYLVALAWEVLDISNNSAGALATAGIAWTVPQVLFLLAGGVLSDRLDRRYVLCISDVIRGVAVAMLGILSVTNAIELWHVYTLVALHGVGEAFFMPAFGSIVPDVVPKNLLVEANSLDNFVRPVVYRLLGPATGGAIVAIVGAGSAFLVDAATFGVSALAILSMTPRPVSDDAPRDAVVEQVREGFRFVRSQRWIFVSLIMMALGQLAFFGPYQVLLPLVVKDQLGGGALAFGVVLALGGLGSIAASLALAQRGLPRRHITFMYASFSAGIGGLAAWALATSLWQVAATAVAMMSLFTIGIIIWGTLLHRLVPSNILGRVSSLDWLVSTSLLPLSYGLVGPLEGALGVDATLIVAALLGAPLTLALLFVPKVRDPERTRPGPTVGDPARV